MNSVKTAAAMLLLGILIGKFVPSFPAPVEFLSSWLWIILLIVAVVLLIIEK